MREGDVPGTMKARRPPHKEMNVVKGRRGNEIRGNCFFCSEEKANAPYVETATKDERQKRILHKDTYLRPSF